MKTILFGILLFANTLLATAQPTYAKYTDYDKIKRRPLVVVTLEVDQKKIDKLNEKLSKTKLSKRYKKLEKEIEEEQNFVDVYNNNIKNLVKKYLNYHPEITYMSNSEYNRIEPEAIKQKKYTVLWFTDTSKDFENFGIYQSNGVSIPTLNYSRIENANNNIDYSIYIPYYGKNYHVLTKTNMELTFRLMLQHMDYIEMNKKNKFTFIKYARNQMAKNCHKLAGNDIYIAADNIGKNTTIEEINAKYKKAKVKLVSHKELEKIIDANENKVIAIVVPLGIAGKISSKVLFVRILINASDNTIYTIKGSRMGEFYDGKFRAKEFKEYGRCK